jgi:hypothetical protein
MATQTTYSTNIAPPSAGTIAGQRDSARIATGICETASPGIPFGRAVGQGTLSNEGTLLGAATYDKFKGVSVRDITLRGDGAVVDAYLPPNSMGILEQGDIWVAPGEAVAAHDSVYFVPATGVFMKTNAGGAILIPGAFFKTAAGVSGLAILSLPMGKLFTATALASV